MKKIYPLVIVFLLLVSANESIAKFELSHEIGLLETEYVNQSNFECIPEMDAWFKKRKKCRWWRKKYKVKAKVKKNGGSSFGGYGKGCTHAYKSTYQQDYCNDYLVIAAASEAEAGDICGKLC